MKLVIIDLSNQTEIKILNTTVKKYLQIHSAYYLTIPEEANPVDACVKKLKSVGLLNIPVIIIPPREIMHYQNFHFPIIPDKEIRKIIPREISKYTDSKEEIIFDVKTGATVIEKNEKKKEVMVYYIKKKELWDLLEQFKKQRIRTLKVVPEVFCLESFIQKNILSAYKQEANGVVIIDMMTTKINMNIFNRSTWSLNREFPFKMDASATMGDRDFSRISTEFSRTFQYFKQKNKNVSIDEAFLFGSNPEITVLDRFINDNQPVGSSLISQVDPIEKIDYPPNLKNREEFNAIFFVAIAAANSFIEKNCVDLYPKEYIEKEKLPKQIIFFTVLGILLVAVLFFFTSFYLEQKNEYQADRKKIEKEFNILQAQMDRIDALKKRRKNYYEKIILMEKPRKVSYQVSDFIRRLSLIITKDLPLQVSKLNILPGEEKINFLIEGIIHSEDINSALTTFDKFLKKLKSQYNVKILNFTSPSSTTFQKVQAGSTWGYLIQGESEIIMGNS